MEDLLTYIVRFTTNLPPLQELIFVVSAVVGLVMFINGMVAANHSTKRGEKPAGRIIMQLIVGALMFSLSTLMDIASYSIFGLVADPQIINKAVSPSGDSVRRGIQALVSVINVVGWLAFARGMYLLGTGPGSQKQGWLGEGMVRIFAGILCVNFYVFADALAVSVGAMEVGTAYFKF